jgi:hypothetical protein
VIAISRSFEGSLTPAGQITEAEAVDTPRRRLRGAVRVAKCLQVFGLAMPSFSKHLQLFASFFFGDFMGFQRLMPTSSPFFIAAKFLPSASPARAPPEPRDLAARDENITRTVASSNRKRRVRKPRGRRPRIPPENVQDCDKEVTASGPFCD